MIKDSNNKLNELQNFLLEKCKEDSKDAKGIPLSFFAMKMIRSTAVFPRSEESLFHNEKEYFCIPFNKPISQYSKLI